MWTVPVSEPVAPRVVRHAAHALRAVQWCVHSPAENRTVWQRTLESIVTQARGNDLIIGEDQVSTLRVLTLVVLNAPLCSHPLLRHL